MAVYTQVHTQDIEAVLHRFGLGRLRSFRGIAEGVENSNYLIESEQDRFILTLYERRVEAKDLPFFLGLMEHLNASGIACPLPLHDKTGTALFELQGRPAAVISYLDGASIEIATPQHCEQLGEALAKLHVAQQGFRLSRDNSLSLKGWETLADSTKANADTLEPGLARAIVDEIEALKILWPDVGDLPQGVIHADLFPDNVFFLNGTLSGIIDFYFACNDALAYDLAICINAWCFDANGQYSASHAAALRKGYNRIRPLESNETALLNTLCRGAALRFLLTRLYDLLNPPKGSMVTPKNPIDYLTRLKYFQTTDAQSSRQDPV